MFPCLYLDTARLGRMCPEAQAADQDFARLAGEVGCSLYFEHFLRWGFSSLPPSLSRRYSGLSFWAGVTAFKRDLKTVLAIDRRRQVLVANRSAQLVRLAARLLCLRCENILVTDMEWPAYVAVLEAECQRAGRTLTTVPIRQAVFRDGITKEELVGRLAAHYRQHDCDGLFLSAVTYQGVRMPIRETVEAIGPASRPRFVVVDGAQALNHVPLRATAESCDLLLTGCHKWLRAYHPLGLAFCCRVRSERYINTVCCEMFLRGELDDPLLSFTTQLEGEKLERFSETVNLAPMFTAAAAVRAMMRSDRTKRAELAAQIDNVEQVVEHSHATGWRSIRPDNPMHTGILLLEAINRQTRDAPIDRLRERFLSGGIALTAYAGGFIRASLPDRPLNPVELNTVHSALARCA
jgi:hypothetical protein